MIVNGVGAAAGGGKSACQRGRTFFGENGGIGVLARAEEGTGDTGEQLEFRIGSTAADCGNGKGTAGIFIGKRAEIWDRILCKVKSLNTGDIEEALELYKDEIWDLRRALFLGDERQCRFCILAAVVLRLIHATLKDGAGEAEGKAQRFTLRGGIENGNLLKILLRKGGGNRQRHNRDCHQHTEQTADTGHGRVRRSSPDHDGKQRGGSKGDENEDCHDGGHINMHDREGIAEDGEILRGQRHAPIAHQHAVGDAQCEPEGSDNHRGEKEALCQQNGAVGQRNDSKIHEEAKRLLCHKAERIDKRMTRQNLNEKAHKKCRCRGQINWLCRDFGKRRLLHGDHLLDAFSLTYVCELPVM